MPNPKTEKLPAQPVEKRDSDLFGTAPDTGADGAAGMPEHRLHGEVLRVVYAADDGEYAVIRKALATLASGHY